VVAGGGRAKRVVARESLCEGSAIRQALYYAAVSLFSYLKSLRGRCGEEALASRVSVAELDSTELDPSEVGIIGVGRGGRDDAIDAVERA
jgi:hypothetical protein